MARGHEEGNGAQHSITEHMQSEANAMVRIVGPFAVAVGRKRHEGHVCTETEARILDIREASVAGANAVTMIEKGKGPNGVAWSGDHLPKVVGEYVNSYRFENGASSGYSLLEDAADRVVVDLCKRHEVDPLDRKTRESKVLQMLTDDNYTAKYLPLVQAKVGEILSERHEKKTRGSGKMDAGLSLEL
jgi:hypothetical protein